MHDVLAGAAAPQGFNRFPQSCGPQVGEFLSAQALLAGALQPGAPDANPSGAQNLQHPNISKAILNRPQPCQLTSNTNYLYAFMLEYMQFKVNFIYKVNFICVFLKLFYPTLLCVG
jgi:hypothetical protein